MGNNPIVIKKIILHRLRMELKNPFRTSFGTVKEKDFFLIEMIDENDLQGFGESVAFSAPWYTEETVKTTEHMMEDFLIPLLFKEPIIHPDDVSERFSSIIRNNMAKAGLEGAVWDLYAKRNGQTLAESLGGKKKEIEVGISIGIQPTIGELLKRIEKSLTDGYKRIKIKIKPGLDVSVVKEIRKHFPDIPLMVDANSAYTLKDMDHLKKLDEFNLLMIEQPLAHNDIVEHAKLQAVLETPICLDESIYSLKDVQAATEWKCGKVMNIKIGRVGGLTEAKKIHDYCKEKNIPVWCGGMLEAGVGRAHNIAISTLDQFVFPGDLSPSNRYWYEDIIEPEVTMDHGIITVPTNIGFGYEINWKRVESFRVDKKTFIN